MKIQIDKSGNVLAWGVGLQGKNIVEAELPEKFDQYYSKYYYKDGQLVLKPGESIPEEKQIGAALGAVLQATPDELSQIKKLLGV